MGPTSSVLCPVFPHTFSTEAVQANVITQTSFASKLMKRWLVVMPAHVNPVPLAQASERDAARKFLLHHFRRSNILMLWCFLQTGLDFISCLFTCFVTIMLQQAENSTIKTTRQLCWPSLKESVAFPHWAELVTAGQHKHLAVDHKW